MFRRQWRKIYITFLRAGMSTLGIYPKQLVPKYYYFRWTSRNKIQRIYWELLKGGNIDHKYLSCPYLQGNNFDIIHSAIPLEKVDLVCAETVKSKSTGNDSCFIMYLNIIYFYVIQLDNSCYLITQWKFFIICIVVQKVGKNRKVFKVGKIGAKYDILTVQERSISHIGNKTKRSLEMNSWKKEVDKLWLKVNKIQMKKKIENNKYFQIQVETYVEGSYR